MFKSYPEFLQIINYVQDASKNRVDVSENFASLLLHYRCPLPEFSKMSASGRGRKVVNNFFRIKPSGIKQIKEIKINRLKSFRGRIINKLVFPKRFWLHFIGFDIFRQRVFLKKLFAILRIEVRIYFSKNLFCRCHCLPSQLIFKKS